MVQIQSKRAGNHSSHHYYPYHRRKNILIAGFLLPILTLIQILSSTSFHSLSVSALLVPQCASSIPFRRGRNQKRIIWRVTSSVDNSISKTQSSSSVIATKRNEMATIIVSATRNEGEEKESAANSSPSAVSIDGSGGSNASASTSTSTSDSKKGGAGKGEREGEGGKVTKMKKREKVMAFLRKTGRIGSNKDFSTAIGVDEGPAGQIRSGVSQVTKAATAYKWCTETGIIDDMSENLPRTSSGTEWSGFTDKVMGGVSVGKLIREVVDGKNANVMKGKVSLYNNGGFIQMAAGLSTDPAVSLTVDASTFDGVELDVLYRGDEDVEKFNVHLRNPACLRQFSSYRGTFEVRSNVWETIRLPWSSFVGHGPGSDSVPFASSELRRIGIVAIGKPMEVYLAVSSVGFYRNT